MISERMHLLLNGILLCTVGPSVADTRVASEFRRSQIVPKFLDVAPDKELGVEYDNHKLHVGQEMTPMQVIHEPKIYYDADDNSFYTLIMIDLDAPTRKNPYFSEFLHWLVVNIPGNDIPKGNTLSSYLSSSPPIPEDIHRYTFLLYKQPENIIFYRPQFEDFVGRQNFSSRNFAQKYNFGNPIAGNMYYARYDENVPILLEKFRLRFLL